MKYLAVLGRQPEISMAELEALFGNIKQIAPHLAVFQTQHPVRLNRLGGCQKIGKLIKHPLAACLAETSHRLTLGFSDYSKRASGKATLAQALRLKQQLKNHGRSVRIVNVKSEPTLSSATTHHNQLGEKAGHLEILRLGEEYYLSLGTQNITNYTKRDQARPARDAKNGMLPPKLAQILINLAGNRDAGAHLLDPFCGTGVVLQEAALMGYEISGSDLNPAMIEHTRTNLTWLGHQAFTEKFIKRTKLQKIIAEAHLKSGSATTTQWEKGIDLVASEIYLGPPMSNPPSSEKLQIVQREITALLRDFLTNLYPQLNPQASVVLAIPAWLRPDGSYNTLSWLDQNVQMGYNQTRNIADHPAPLLYHREGQIVAREIIILRK